MNSSNRKSLSVFLILVSLEFLGFISASVVKAAVKAAPVGRLAFVRGDVELNRKPARDGQSIAQGDQIETLEGKCSLFLGTGAVIHMDRQTKITVNEYFLKGEGKGPAQERTALQLDHGKTRALIQNSPAITKTFQVRSRGATLGVRGTQFIMETPKEPQLPQRFLTVEGVATVTLAPTHSAGPTGSPGALSSAGSAQATGMVTITLKNNESLQTSSTGESKTPQVVKLSESTVKQIAAQVSAPVSPANLSVGDRLGAAGAWQSQMGIKGELAALLPSGLALDPLADGFFAPAAVTSYVNVMH